MSGPLTKGKGKINFDGHTETCIPKKHVLEKD